jgi:hypothetical protein
MVLTPLLSRKQVQTVQLSYLRFSIQILRSVHIPDIDFDNRQFVNTPVVDNRIPSSRSRVICGDRADVLDP